MNFFNYFKEEPNFINVYKKIEFPSDIINSSDYSLHTPNDYDNLMKISHQYYNTIDDWWIIYYFNKMNDITFAISTDAIQKNTIDYYVNLLVDFNILDYEKRLEITEAIRQYFLESYSLVDAIKKTNEQLSTIEKRQDVNFILDFKLYLMNYMVTYMGVTDNIKIPNLSLVFKMKTYVENLSVNWKS